jgi:hypothetical protein
MAGTSPAMTTNVRGQSVKTPAAAEATKANIFFLKIASRARVLFAMANLIDSARCRDSSGILQSVAISTWKRSWSSRPSRAKRKNARGVSASL